MTQGQSDVHTEDTTPVDLNRKVGLNFAWLSFESY